MQKKQTSLTALISAYARAYHSLYDSPKIFDDYLAEEWFIGGEFKQMGGNVADSLGFYNPELAASVADKKDALAWVMQNMNGPITISRARYTEDNLVTAIKQGAQQYVILGAGMDTFAFRQPELLEKIQVFELDHLATQAFKQNRIKELGWKKPANLHFIPIDFTEDNLTDILEKSPYDSQVLSFFSWLGVTLYLTPEVVFNVLRTITDIAPPGSSIVFDYLDNDAFVPDKAAKRMSQMRQILETVGEPLKGSFNPTKLGNELESLELLLYENLSPEDIERRYFKGRSDDYHAFEHVHFAWAKVK